MKYFLSSIALLATIYLAIVAFRLYEDFEEYIEMKEDYAEISRLNYSLFNIQKWKTIAMDVFTKEISQFQISPKAYDEAKAELEKYLHSIYETYIVSGVIFDQVIADAEREGKVNKVMLKMLKENIKEQIVKLKIKEHIPAMAVQLADELKNNEPRLRTIMQEELTRLIHFNENYPVTDPRTTIYAKYKTTDFDSASAFLKTQIEVKRVDLDQRVKYLFAALMVCIGLVAMMYYMLGINLVISLISLISLVFLGIGVNLPMIEIDARMNSFVFNLFDKDISFGEQSVLFQSKSILGVTKTLLESRGIDLKIVGYMVLCFSVVFPMIKLILSAFYLGSARLQKSKLIKSIIFYLGKWSMADVFVVALFMAYIGFFGLVDSQLGAIEQNKGGFAVETVNYTHLGPGALFFTAYCVLSIILGTVISKRVDAA